MKKVTMLLLAISLVSASAFAQAGHTGSCTCGEWDNLPMAWVILHDELEYVAAAQAEFQHWNDVVTLFNAQVPTIPPAVPPSLGDGLNQIMMLNAQEQVIYGLPLDEDTFGVAPSAPEEAFGDFNACPVPQGIDCSLNYTEADVLINEDFARGFTPTGPPDYDDDNGPAYYGATALHELGHTFGLHHNFDNLSTMNYYEDFAAQYLSRADAVAVREAYPSGARTMTDLATYPFYYDPAQEQYDGTQLVTINPTTIEAGSLATIDNVTVENVGTTDLTQVAMQIYLSSDQVITGSDILISQGAFDGTFAAGAVWDTAGGSRTISVQIPPTVPAGTYYWGGRIVYNSSQTDQITYNNTWVAPNQVTVSSDGGPSGPCTPSSSDICLNSSRFRVSLAATNPRDGRTGAGFAIPYNDLNGFFAIPDLTNDTTNFEVFVKILDGRAFNGKFWVFYGGLTDFEYTITVTDTESGQQKQYFKPGREFTGGADTEAF
jgi:hypothetical protein